MTLPGEPLERESVSLEPHHTNFVLVPGSRWGDEARWIAHFAAAVEQFFHYGERWLHYATRSSG